LASGVAIDVAEDLFDEVHEDVGLVMRKPKQNYLCFFFLRFCAAKKKRDGVNGLTFSYLLHGVVWLKNSKV
jgi:hypothetical protein